MNNYFNQGIPPVRDDRLEVADAYHGCSCDLVNCSKSGCLLNKNRSFWQSSSSCQMGLSIIMSSTVENSVLIVHGPIGCGSALHNLTASSNAGKANRGLPVKPVNWLSTNLSQSDVIAGGEEKLKDAIDRADREFRPDIIFVISTCAPNIIGDDVEKIVADANKTAAAQVTAIHCPGFKSRMVSSAYDAFYHSLLRNIRFEPIPYVDFVPLSPAVPNAELQETAYQFKKAHTLNLFSLESAGAKDEVELTRLLNALDLTVNVVAEYSNADKLRFVSEVALNVSLCNMHDDYIVSYLKEKYDIPYYMGMPLGFEATRKWLVSIGAYFGLQERANKLADYEEKLLKKALEPYLEKLKGKRILFSGGSVRSAVEAPALRDLGLEVIGLIGYLYDSNADPVFEDLAKEMPDLPVVVSEQPFEFINQIKKYKPDIVLTHAGYLQIPAKVGVPTVYLFDTESPYFGYSGLFEIARKICFTLENASYERHIARHIKLPYKSSWYEKDPFSYHKE